MTDNEIIKAWEKILATGDAPFGKHWGCSITTELAKDTFDMLNRQKAEIERLKRHNKEYGFCNLLGNCLVYSKNLKDYNDMRKGLKTEAIKEVLLMLEAEAERSEEYSQKHDNSREQQAYIRALWKACNLVKEMTEQ